MYVDNFQLIITPYDDCSSVFSIIVHADSSFPITKKKPMLYTTFLMKFHVYYIKNNYIVGCILINWQATSPILSIPGTTGLCNFLGLRFH